MNNLSKPFSPTTGTHAIDRSSAHSPILSARPSPTVLATAAIAATTLVTLSLKLLNGRLIANPLGPEVFGWYSTLIGIVTIASLFSRGGLVTAVRISLLRSNDAAERERLIGAAVVLALARGVLIVGLLYALLPLLNMWYGDEISRTILAIGILFTILPTVQMIPHLAPANGCPYLVARSRLISGIAWTVIGSSLVIFGLTRLEWLATGFVLAQVAVLPTAWRVLRPRFQQLASSLRKISSYWRSYGIHQYFAQLCEQGTHLLVVVLVPVLCSPAEYGCLCIAHLIAGQTSLLSNSLFQARFRTIASQARVPAKYIRGNLTCLVVSACGVLLLQLPLVRFIYGDEFLLVTQLVPIVLIGWCFHAAYQPYLAAITGWADRRFKYTSFASSAAAAVLYPVLVVQGQVWGAAIGHAIVKSMSWGLLYGFYRYMLATRKPTDSNLSAEASV